MDGYQKSGIILLFVGYIILIILCYTFHLENQNLINEIYNYNVKLNYGQDNYKNLKNRFITCKYNYSVQEYNIEKFNNKFQACESEKRDIQEHCKEMEENISNKYNEVIKRADKMLWEASVYKPSYFERIIVEVANANEYVLDEYDCTEFSNDLAYELRKEGWNAKIHHVVVDCDSDYFEDVSCNKYGGRHDIVRISNPIYVEATSGNIIRPKDYIVYGVK